MVNSVCSCCIFSSVYRDMGASVPVCLFNDSRDLSIDANRCDTVSQSLFCPCFLSRDDSLHILREIKKIF